MKYATIKTFVKSNKDYPFSTGSNLIMLCLGLLCLTSCGSTKDTTIDAWGLGYHRTFDIHDRVYATDMVGLVLEVTYHPDNQLPHVRVGFATAGHIVDTTGNDMPHVVHVKRKFSIPWLFESEIETVSAPIPFSNTRVEDILNREQELLFNPDAEAIP